MTNNTTHSESLSFKQKIKKEAKEAFALSIYLGIWFCSLAFFAATALDERPIPLSIFGFAFIKAALCAKFMLIALAVHPIKIDKNHGVVFSLIFESIVYILVVIALNYLEAGVRGVINGKEFLISMTAFGQADPLRVFAMSILYWLIIWPYLIFLGVNITLGTNATLAILFGDKK
ncbi:hypothetical protein [Polynucleobacter sp. MWH-Braz-FAM2G]|uniref:hypothetical protein n=1 Tax=Polynucleobacter sp. MWH-Braz-FAM2G TaxID=1855883 RepID=UPI001BFDCC8C|nr:hypothetical protein [Polynucleobacter sp. MWH-Braz-FAM2G]QWD91697.1 hypothetical protein FD973_05055 [Polynucleobacter sp. MWH-Braz-FAM2G]